jgi:histidyl-tRNA synthetase
MFSKKSEPVCGGSLGIERIIMLLSEGAPPARVGPTAYVTVWDAASAAEALTLAGSLRAAGVRAEIDLTGAGLGQQLRMADERGCRAAVIRGPDEAASGVAQVKLLETGAQTTIALDKLADHLLSLQG